MFLKTRPEGLLTYHNVSSVVLRTLRSLITVFMGYHKLRNVTHDN